MRDVLDKGIGLLCALIFCRDALVHFSYGDIRFTTSFEGIVNYDIRTEGGARSRAPPSTIVRRSGSG